MDIINERINNPALDDVVRKGQLNVLKWISRRDRLGELYDTSRQPVVSNYYSRTKFFKGLYSSFGHQSTWNNAEGNPYHYGAIFNFDFSPDG